MNRTPLTNTENIFNCINESWDETDENVKADFGNEYIESFRNSFSYPLFLRKDPNEVAQAIVFAVSSKKPQTRYICCGYLFRLLLWLAEHFPSELTDIMSKVAYHVYYAKPKALKDSLF